MFLVQTTDVNVDLGIVNIFSKFHFQPGRAPDEFPHLGWPRNDERPVRNPCKAHLVGVLLGHYGARLGTSFSRICNLLSQIVIVSGVIKHFPRMQKINSCAPSRQGFPSPF